MTKRLSALLLAFILCLSLTACGAGSAYESMDSIADSMLGGMTTNDSVSMDKGFFNDGYDNSYESESKLETETPDTDAPVVQTINEKLIYTGELSLETIEFDKALASINSLITRYGGFIESSDIDGNVTYNDDGTAKIMNRYAAYIIRIPAASFETVMTEAGSIGNVTNSHSEATNVTSQFTDNEARLSALKLQEERLLAIMAAATEVTDLIELEKRIAEVRYEIEFIERTLRDLQSQVSYSTIELYVEEVGGYEEAVSVQRTFGERIGDGFKKGWGGFIGAIQGIVVGAAEVSPILILIGIVAGVFIYTRKKNGKTINPKETIKKLVTEDDSEDENDD